MSKRNDSLKLTRLTYYLIIKSIIDVLLVATLALGFYLTAFSPYFHGWVDDANSRWIRGWVINRADAAEDIEAQLYIDGRFIESQSANKLRPDIVASQLAENEKHGFFFTTPPLNEGEHEARVFAVQESGGQMRRTLQLIGKPFRFITEANPAEPYFRGSVDEANEQYVKGWVIDSTTPAANPEVQLYIDKRFIESRAANQPRPDLVAARIAEDEKHGFFFITPPLNEGEHDFRVYVVQESDSERERVLRLLEKPVRFIVEAAGSKLPDEENKTSENSSR